MRARSGILTALAVLALGVALLPGITPAHAWNPMGDKTVSGSGHSATEKRELGSFEKIAVSLPCKVVLIQGDGESVLIEADDNLLPLIETVVHGGQLTIQPVKGVNVAQNNTIKVTVNARRVDQLSVATSAEVLAARLRSSQLDGSIAGSGKILIKDLQVDKLSISIAGSGRFEAQGAATAMDVNIAGSGDLHAARLSAQNVTISIAGSGDATVWVRKVLSVSIAGSGDVRYYGEGTLRDSSTMGSGHVKQMGATPPV